ncbi:DUF2059 domain-containing protein [Martelella alba]|uniref:DUF2059 domain-containing protein n=1 Tax=Martelella alba TaxID=2590451 RepID=A0A506UA10_9HYPH|nr:DUF2059 domain-containing protein [Martelella alba]TPW29785.1 DUF2059 domain-containing protein [Martelella alba]
MLVKAKVGRSIAVAVAALGIGFCSVASAQEVSPEQLQAARGALDALGITEQFNSILPDQAGLVEAQLLQVYPNYADEIDDVVTNVAVSLASRRNDLEQEAAQIYAKVFTVDELKQLTAFYASDVGKKFIQYGPIASRELSQAGDTWAQGIARDLNQQAMAELTKKIGSAGGAPAPEPAN